MSGLPATHPAAAEEQVGQENWQWRQRVWWLGREEWRRRKVWKWVLAHCDVIEREKDLKVRERVGGDDL